MQTPPDKRMHKIIPAINKKLCKVVPNRQSRPLFRATKAMDILLKQQVR
jgi:hypothetical protein